MATKITSDAFIKKLKPAASLEEAKLKSPLILVGADSLRIKRIVHWLRDKFFAGQSRIHFGTELTSQASLSHIVASLKSLSLFSSAELIVVYEADKVRKTPLRNLAEAVNEAQGAGFLLLTTADAKKAATLKKEFNDKASVVDVSELKGPLLRRWIEKEVKTSGAAGIESSAIELLINCYGSDANTLSREINKLCLVANKDEPINKELVAKHSFTSPERTSFELLNQIARKNTAASIALCKQLLEQGFHPLQLLGFFSRAFRTMLAQKEKEQGQALASELANAWYARQVSPAMKGFSTEELSSSIDLLKDLDFQLKNTGLSPELLVSLATQRLALREV